MPGKRPGLDLRTIAVASVLLVAVPMVALLLWSNRHLQTAAAEDAAAHARAMAEVVARRHSQLVADARGLLSALAQMSQLSEDAAHCDSMLERLLAARPGYTNLGVIGVDGRVVCSALPFERGLNLGDRAYFRNAIDSDGFVAGVYQVGRITGVPGINFGYPVRDRDGRLQSVVFAAIGTDWLAELVDRDVLPAGATVTVVDDHLQVLAHFPPGAGSGALLAASPILNADIGKHPDGGSFTVLGPHEVEWRYTYVPLGGLTPPDAPYLLLGLPPDALQAQLVPFTRYQLFTVIAALVALAVVAWLVVHRLVLWPTRRLSLAASRLAEGERGVRLPESRHVIELAVMSNAFNRMATQVDGAVRAFQVLSAGNRSLLREYDEERLLQAMCEVVVEEGGYRYAWVAYMTQSGIQQVAGAGDDGGFAAYLQSRWQTVLEHQTPTIRALTSGEPVAQQFLGQGTPQDMYQTAASRGLHAGLVLPLKVDGQVIGCLTIYAGEPDAFLAREQLLLAELADDLSFGIANVRLRQLAYFDAVTGLPNRGRFLDELATVAGNQRQVAILVVELHNYWEVATALGHACGDEFLQLVAERLRSQEVRQVARLAQSEFVLRLDTADESAACHCADRVLAALAAPAGLSVISVDIEASVGVAVGGAERAERLLQAARLAAREAATGHGRVLLAAPQPDGAWNDRLRLAVDLRAAIDARTVRVQLQPQVDLHSGQVCAMEALARWWHPQHGELAPTRFIGLAERTGLIRGLTRTVLQTVCEQAARRTATGRAVPVAVNVSARSLRDPSFVGQLSEMLERWPLPRRCLQLELTENALMSDPALSLRVLQQLRDLGLPVYLDDFGTGCLSLAYLRELPLAGIKIDGSFITGLAQPRNRSIVRTVADLGHALGLTVVAQGVEDAALLPSLRELGCDRVQGSCIAPPMPADEVDEWISRWPGLAATCAPGGSR